MRVLTDRWAFAIAGAAVVGAAVAPNVPLAVAVGVIVGALLLRSPPGLCLGIAIVVGALAASESAPASPEPGSIDARASLVGDPIPWAGGTRVDADIDGVRYELQGFGAVAARMRDLLAGESIAVEGRARPTDGDPFRARRGVTGVVSVESVQAPRRASGPAGLANSLRRTLERGATSLEPDDRALFLGIVIGDDRGLSVEVEDDFRAAGLSHLVAVSGQNVAFVLMLAGPLLRRVEHRSRWLLTILLLGFFGLVTRFEPSVVRATAMAGVAATATALGRESSAVRSLSFAVVLALMVDPGLVDDLGFRLSVAATVGILAVAPRLIVVLPGPRVVREAAAVTIGAQLAVSPLLVTTFGGVPVASIPANLAAGPAAGPVMLWGLSAGTIAGVVGGRVAAVVHTPTGVLTQWLRVVARTAATAPLGQLGLGSLLVGGVVVGAMLLGRRPRLAVAVALVILLLPSLAYLTPSNGRFEATDGVVVWRQAGATVVELSGTASSARALAGLRAEAVRDIDALVLTTGSSRNLRVAATIEKRHRVGVVLTPTDTQEVVDLGPIRVALQADSVVVSWVGVAPPGR